MCPFSEDEARKSNRKHAACTNGVRTKDHDLWTDEFSMIPRKQAILLIYLQIDPNNP
jgi:hypothetical protein